MKQLPALPDDNEQRAANVVEEAARALGDVERSEPTVEELTNQLDSVREHKAYVAEALTAWEDAKKKAAKKKKIYDEAVSALLTAIDKTSEAPPERAPLLAMMDEAGEAPTV